MKTAREISISLVFPATFRYLQAFSRRQPSQIGTERQWVPSLKRHAVLLGLGLTRSGLGCLSSMWCTTLSSGC